MSLYDSTKSLLRICQFFGLTPFKFDRKAQKWQLNSFLIYLSATIIFCNVIVFVGSIIFNELATRLSSNKGFMPYSQPLYYPGIMCMQFVF